jgi:hypothetical protein
MWIARETGIFRLLFERPASRLFPWSKSGKIVVVLDRLFDCLLHL